MKSFFASILLLFCLCTNAQNITTIAGNGTLGYSGNGGLATSAQLAFPRGVVTDNAGNVYIADEYNNVIRKINSAGIISNFAGTGVAGYSGDGGLALNANLYHPSWMAIDNANNFYLIDGDGGDVIRKIDNNGIITSITGNLPRGYSGDGGPLMGARFRGISGIAFDNIGNMFISDASNYVIRKVNSLGIITTIAGNGTTGFSGDGSLATLAQLGVVYSVVFDNAGNMFIPDPQNLRIRKVSNSGIITTFAGTGAIGYFGDGGPANIAKFRYPWIIDIDNVGNLFIADALNFAVRKVDNSGIITTVAGNGLYGNTGDGGIATSATLGYSCLVHIDASNNLLISVRDNYHVVRKVNFFCTTATITQQPGNLSLCNSGNATFSTSATNISGYQWQEKVSSNWNNISNNAIYSGATTNTLNIIGVNTTFNNYQYRCELTNSCGISFTNPATLFVTTPTTPTININTAANTICQGAATTFTATATNAGTAPVYQWKKNGINVGSNSSIYNVNTLVNGDIISCLLTSNATCLSSATASSNNIIMTVNAPVAATLSINSGSNNICSGTTITFNTTATNEGTSPIYQWKNNGISVGSNSSSYSTNVLNNGDIISCTLTSNQSCLVSNTVNSNNITMVVNPSFTPTITITANTNNVCAGTPITFNSTTTNSGTSQIYQWKKNGTNVGTNSSSYTDNTLITSDNISCNLSVAGAGCYTTNFVNSNSIQLNILEPALPTVTISTANTSVCRGTPISFSSSAMSTTATTNYQWLKNGFAVGNNTSTYTDINMLNGDVLQLSLTTSNNNDCIAATTVASNIITMTVYENPTVTLDHSNTICDGGNRSLDAGSFATYLWNTGSSQRLLNVTGMGVYYVTVKDNNGCIGSDSTKISALLPKPSNFLLKDTSICTYGSLLITAKDGYKSYVWSDFSTKSTLMVLKPGTYELTVTDSNNCKAKENIIVTKKQGCIKGFYVPSAFSPNSDNKNDSFKPIIYGNLKKYKFIIFNRYGQPLFETTDPNKGWDGKLYGEIGNTSGFIWVCNYQLDGESEVVKKGSFVLLR